MMMGMLSAFVGFSVSPFIRDAEQDGQLVAAVDREREEDGENNESTTVRVESVDSTEQEHLDSLSAETTTFGFRRFAFGGIFRSGTQVTRWR